MAKFFKKADILDPVHETLAPDVFDANQHMYPHVREYAIKRIKSLTGDAYTSAYMLGSLTGYQYSDSSDVDVNVTVPLAMITAELQATRKATNGQLIPGTKRAFSIMLQPMEITNQEAWQDSRFGVYDILKDNWLVPPEDYKTLRDPADAYVTEFITVRMVLNHFKNYINEWKKAKRKLAIYQQQATQDKKTLMSLQTKVEQTYSDLQDFAFTIDAERKMDYDWGWGTPRVSWRNVLFKYFEDSVYGGIFHELVEERGSMLKKEQAINPAATFMKESL